MSQHGREAAARGGALTLRVPRAYITRSQGLAILAGWQSGYATDCKSVYSGSIPLPASNGTMSRFFSERALIPGSSVVEQAAVNRWVDGSNPSRGANSRTRG